METAKRIIILLAMLLLTGEAAQPAGKSPDSKAAATPTATQISNTHSASCIVKVTCDPAVLPLNFQTIEYLLHSTGVSGKAARDVLGVPPDAASNLFQIEDLSSTPGFLIPPYPPQGQIPPAPQEGPGNEKRAVKNPSASLPEPKPSAEPVPTPGQPPRTGIPRPSTTPEQTILFQLQVDLPEDSQAKPAAVEFMNALISNLRSTLGDASQAYVANLNSQFKQAGLEANNAEAELVMLQSKIRELAGGRDLSPGAITNQIRDLREKLEMTKMEYASNEGTIQGITERIAKTQARIEEQLKNDQVANELQAITERIAREVADIEARVKQEGPALSAALQNTREQLTKARIDLAKRREEMSRSDISSLNNKIADISVGQPRAAAYRAGIERQLAEADGLLPKADEYELLLLKADLARQNLQQAIIWRDKMKRQAGFLPVADVLVLGGS